MDSVVQVLTALGGIVTVIGAIVTGAFTMRVRMRRIEQTAKDTIRKEDEERAKRIKAREDAFNARVDKAFDELQGRYDDLSEQNAGLQAKYAETLARLDALESQRERDVVRIRELETKVIQLGGTL